MVIRSQRPIFDRIVGKSRKYSHTNFQWHIKCGDDDDFVINVFRRQGCPHLGQGHGPIVSSRHNKMWFGFQFNLSDSSDDDLYRLILDPEGQGHQ